MGTWTRGRRVHGDGRVFEREHVYIQTGAQEQPIGGITGSVAGIMQGDAGDSTLGMEPEGDGEDTATDAFGERRHPPSSPARPPWLLKPFSRCTGDRGDAGDTSALLMRGN